MTATPRDLAFKASAALESASTELREGRWDDGYDSFISPLEELEALAYSLEEIIDGVREGMDPLCEAAANRLTKEVKSLIAARERLNEEAAQLLRDADEALQLQLKFNEQESRELGRSRRDH